MSKRETKRVEKLQAAGVDVCVCQCRTGGECKRPVCTGACKLAGEAPHGATTNGNGE
jgi:hypothetical protein